VSSAVRVSDDVVVVGEEQVVGNRWRVFSRVRLVLGERVHFFGYGFEGRLGGELLVEESTGQPTRASGEISVTDGRYRAYGQRLDISQGRLVFSGGPLISPGLDIRAERKVNSITVGILASGTLDRPQIKLFSSPAMGQTDVLSYLILGRPIENASSQEGQAMAKAALALGLAGGDRLARNLRERFELDEMRVDSAASGDQASLVLGRYLTPRLYVSYGIGLIEAFNTFVVRYQISERWQLKAESGEYQGADLLFTIDR
jgi:translocation and assembly module TamB